MMSHPIDLRDVTLPAAVVTEVLALQPHPEGGHYRETWRDGVVEGPRGASTAILFLLAAGQTSRWHRIDADEIWLWQAGAPLRLDVSTDGQGAAAHQLGPDLTASQTLQHVVRRGQWQSAASLGTWSLVACVVAPAFRFEGFELAPPGWQPINGSVAG